MKNAICLFVLLLAGCATQPESQPWAWWKPDATREIYEADNGQCQAQGMGVPGAMNNLMQVALVYNSCMRGKGWYQKPVAR